jgi:hypothetical protein
MTMTFSDRREKRREDRRRRIDLFLKDRARNVEPSHFDAGEAYSELFSDLGYRLSGLSIRAARRLEEGS